MLLRDLTIRWNFIRRAQRWVRYTERAVSDLQTKAEAFQRSNSDLSARHEELVGRFEALIGQHDELGKQLDGLSTRHEGLGARHESLLGRHDQLRSDAVNFYDTYWKLVTEISGVLIFRGAQEQSANSHFDPEDRFYYAQHADTLFLLRGSANQLNVPWFGGHPTRECVDAIVRGDVEKIWVKTLTPHGSAETAFEATWLIDAVRRMPSVAHLAFARHQHRREPNLAETSITPGSEAINSTAYMEAMNVLSAQPDLINFVAEGFAARHLPAESQRISSIVPFDKPSLLPSAIPAEPKRRSVVFLHNSYYHFEWLAKGLKKRGWDAVTVSIESKDSPQQQFYHGEDINLFDADPDAMRDRVRNFFRTVPERFGALHFYGSGYGSFFKENIEYSNVNTKVPWDLLELKRHSVKIGYMVAGCMDGSLQSSIRNVTGGLCSKCVWENSPSVCSNATNAAWISKLDQLCDWVALEGDWTTPERKGPKFVTRPITTAISEVDWNPDIVVAADKKITRRPNEFLVYHAVGNYESRRRDDRDIKGTGAVLTAIERLKNEGWPVKLFFATDLPSVDVKFYQVQADVVVDQLNYGRLGANARESLMLGRPLITNINGAQDPPLQHIIEAPVAHATEASVYDVLKSLLTDPVRRAELGSAGRSYAIKWHSPDVCAKRYERVIDRLRAGLPAESDEVFE
ncbi:glycosyltransferase [Bradyrhizobium sp. JYMT SZCCT0428]|uniref:glycosyltransferase n=1 Tax=Bradyrhizobium sp. JYMT SZCCT0428 TaxID=2807673 RepID=UPI001BAA661F|nr:glycosyltransferase [Bradyrhizobium sp. JYMT SZCCT0428]MBR1156128.1 glycosyltransferase [Bradyrhizobium sp. JYMT SZCCT0428]